MGIASHVKTGRLKLLGRSRVLQLTKNGLRGPLLIPSISSKGFPIVEGLSEAGAVLPLVGPDLTEALLISAYDLHHGLIPQSSDLLEGSHNESVYAYPELLVVDSGGYELSDSYESGETRRGEREIRRFVRSDFELVADSLPTDRELLVATYDEPAADRPGYSEQREIAQRFKGARRHLKIDFLLKPHASSPFVSPEMLTPEARNLCIFDVIGVTEKELGDNLLERLVCLAKLRQLLDDVGCGTVPIHVFGCLDPILTPLYFMSGGEIFDGLSWLRYAYHDGCAIHPEELAALNGSIDAGQIRRDLLRHMSNLQQLKKLKHDLERWAEEPSRYEVLGRHHEKIREIHETVELRVRKRG